MSVLPCLIRDCANAKSKGIICYFFLLITICGNTKMITLFVSEKKLETVATAGTGEVIVISVIMATVVYFVFGVYSSMRVNNTAINFTSY